MPAPDTSAQKLYYILCQALAERPLAERTDPVDWPSLTSADWQALPALARREGVAPLLYAKLKAGGERIPAAVMAALAAEYYRTAAQNTLLLGELDRILAALDAAGIPVIVLKGAALAQTLYPDPALRPMGDLDLLVKPGDLKRAVQSLADLGYGEYLPNAAPGLTQRLSHHVHLRQRQLPHLIVELHYRLLGSTAFGFSTSGEWFMENARLWQEKYLQAQAVYVPSPTAHLLYLLAHAVLQHGSGEAILLWYYDVAILLRQQGAGINWQQLQQQAQACQWGSALAAGLRIVQDRLQVELPLQAEICLADTPDAYADFVACRRSPAHSRWELEAHKLSNLPWRERLVLIGALVFPAPAYMRWRYRPPLGWLWPLYYPYRWIDITMDFFKTLWIAARKTK